MNPMSLQLPKSSPHPKDPISKHRYTVMLVPQGGRGQIRQITFSLAWFRRLVMTLAGMSVMAVVGLMMLVTALPRTLAYSDLMDENLALKGRLRNIESMLDEVDQELRRLRIYDSQMQGLPSEAVPGFGPLELEDADWLAQPNTRLRAGDALAMSGAYGQPMDDHDVSLHANSPSLWADSIEARAEATLQAMRVAKIEIGEMVESAEQQRAMMAAIPSMWPVDGVLTSGFGWRRSPFTRKWKFHRGIDIWAPKGTVIRAPASGTVITVDRRSGYGRLLEIDHGFGIVSRYAHNSRIYVRKGKKISRGDVVASVGATGKVTGPHLHFEVYVDGQLVDPMEYLK